MIWLWVILLVVLAGGVAVVAAGRGGSMSEPYDDRPDVLLPAERPLTADDLRTVRFSTAVRGYRMDEVDALLARLEAELLDREGLESPAESGSSVRLEGVPSPEAAPAEATEPPVQADGAADWPERPAAPDA